MPRKLTNIFWVPFFLLLCTNIGESQNVLDDVSVDDNSPNKEPLPLVIDLEHPTYIINDILKSDWEGVHCTSFPCYVSFVQGLIKDSVKVTNAQREFIARIEYYRKYYKSPPIALDECIYYNPAFNGVDYMICACNHYHLYPMPEAFRFYSTPADSDSIAYGKYYLKLKLNKPLHEFLEPFYFKKATITNKEYREFVDYVRDSIIRTMLYNAGYNSMVLDTTKDPPVLNWKTPIRLDLTDVQENVNDMYLPDAERFYRNKAIDTRKLNYTYYPKYPPRTHFVSVPGYDYLSGMITDSIGKIVINVYPDTLAWVHDFTFPFMEPMANMYFWHPYFDDYPVVGITRAQAEAYLIWRTAQEQKKLDKEGVWIVNYELPTEYEWEIVESADRKNGEPLIYPDNCSQVSDYSWTTNLVRIWGAVHLSSSSRLINDTTTFKNLQTPFRWSRYSFLPNQKRSIDELDTLFEEFTNAKKRHKYPDVLLKSDFLKSTSELRANPIVSTNYDCNGISFMGDNVSEWMQETYRDNWKKVYKYQHKILEHIPGKDAKFMSTMEDYYNDANDTMMYAPFDTVAGALVRGANWFDSRNGNIMGRNAEGMSAKAFVGTDSAHATIGFRYVVKIYRKDEKQLIDALKAHLTAAK